MGREAGWWLGGAEGPALAWRPGHPSQQAPTLRSLSAPVSSGREAAGRPACCHPPDHVQMPCTHSTWARCVQISPLDPAGRSGPQALRCADPEGIEGGEAPEAAPGPLSQRVRPPAILVGTRHWSGWWTDHPLLPPQPPMAPTPVFQPLPISSWPLWTVSGCTVPPEQTWSREPRLPASAVLTA